MTPMVDVTFLLGMVVDVGIVDGIGQRTAVGFNERDDRPLAIAGAVAAGHQDAGGHPDRKHEHDDQRDAVREYRTHSGNALYSAAAAASGRAIAINSPMWASIWSRANAMQDRP